MAEKIVIEQGIKDYELFNERGEIIGAFSIFPSDVGIVDRCEQAIEFFNSLEYPNDADDSKARNDLTDRIKQQFDLLFGGVSATLFEKIHPLSPIKNGDLFFEAALDAICGVVQKETDARIKAKLKRARAATAKYNR
ncbi:MAG: hypothetical protein J6R01_08120 [Alistipes sp.]|nr:hypothetical protein [Alistipes sp.]